MDESTQTEPPVDTPTTPTGYGYCSWHNRFAAGVRLIDVIEQGSGSGGVHYACPPCIDTHQLTPFADQP